MLSRALKRRPNTRHETHSSQKLATLLLRIYTAICRIEYMHSENSQVHTVVSYCSGGERSVKCVRPGLEMEASKEEQRGVVRFLVNEGAGTRDIHCRMSKHPGMLSFNMITPVPIQPIW